MSLMPNILGFHLEVGLILRLFWFGILGAEYPRPDYHRASGAKPLVGGQGAKPPEAKSNFIFWTSCGSGYIMALGGARVPCAPTRGSANGCISGLRGGALYAVLRNLNFVWQPHILPNRS